MWWIRGGEGIHFRDEEKRAEGVEWSGGKWVRVWAGWDWGSFRGRARRRDATRCGGEESERSPLYRVAVAEVPMHIPYHRLRLFAPAYGRCH
jgi:hypothetical protein